MTEKDLVTLRLKFNDSQIGIFNLNGCVLFGEVTIPGDGIQTTFFITESHDIYGETIDWWKNNQD